MAVKRQEVTEEYAVYCGDCVEVVSDLPKNSVGHVIFSPPFADLYCYSNADADMGNCRSYNDFFTHFGFLVELLEKVVMPGRIVAVHCMDMPVSMTKDGYIGIRDFPGDIVRLFEKNKFIFHSRHCIWKDPLVAATRTKALGLAHKQIVKDSSRCRMGLADYIVAFRKPGENPEPIEHPKGLLTYCGQKQPPAWLNHYAESNEPRTNKLSHWIWQRYASPVWDDIRQTRVLPYREGKEKDDEKHICPLQLDVIERCLILWSNPGDTILTPFMGVGSEVYTAVQLGRKGVGVELKESYYRQTLRNLRMLKTKRIAQAGFK